MAGSLEFAKLVTASLLYQYWDTINKTLRTYLSIATIILVLITSMGIYGFLSAAYQETYSKLSVIENQKSFIQQKINFYQNDVNRYDTEIKRISSNISTLSNAKASTIEVQDSTVSGGIRRTISTTELRMAQSRINIEEENRKLAQKQRTIASDSLQKFQLQVLELDNNNKIAGELGPLQYLSGLTGISMDKIINWLLLIIIFVFDPLAISLVVASNFAFDQAYFKNKNKSQAKDYFKERNKLVDEYTIKNKEKSKEKDLILKNKPPQWFNLEKEYTEEDERRMNIIGQNGNDGDHYDELDINKDGKVDSEDLKGLILLRDKHVKFTDQWNRLNQEVERFKKNTNISN